MQRIILLFFSLLFVNHIWACKCPSLEAIDKYIYNRYEVILSAEVDSIEQCTNDQIKIHVSVLDLFKGRVDKKSVLISSCNTSCSFFFEKGETWLFYLKMNNAQDLIVDFCSHTRKKLPNGVTDYHSDIVGATFEKEIELLHEHFDANSYFSKSLKPRKYEKVEGSTTILLLAIGLVAMVIGLLIFRKKSN